MTIKEYKAVTHTKEVTVGFKCDLCGEVTSPSGWKQDAKSYECDFQAEVRDNYPGGECKGVKAEFCPTCTRVVCEALIKLGVNLEEYSNYD
jgi:hypothetical protein